MRDDFAVFILTHGRPDRVHTYDEIRRSGYTGRIYVVIDDEDRKGPEYLARYGDEVLVFSKAEVAAAFDECDNFDDRRAIFYARNACWELAKRVGVRYFIELDDDYTGFFYRFASAKVYGQWRIRRTMDDLLEALVAFFEATPRILVLAISQGGDHIGGGEGNRSIRMTRKAMNSLICSVDRPFSFIGRINEDVNTYVVLGGRGGLFFTVKQAQLNQLMTQSNAGGMTDLYLDGGTYLKSFYSVMVAPSCVRIGELSDPRSPHRRIHHAVRWDRAVPCILRESVRKT